MTHLELLLRQHDQGADAGGGGGGGGVFSHQQTDAVLINVIKGTRGGRAAEARSEEATTAISVSLRLTNHNSKHINNGHL